MKVFALTSTSNPVEIKLVSRKSESWEYNVAGDVDGQIKDSAKDAVNTAHRELTHLSPTAFYVDEELCQHNITFSLTGKIPDDANISVAFATLFAVDRLLRTVERYFGNLTADFQLVIAGKLGFPRAGTDDYTIDPVDLVDADIEDAVGQIDGRAKLFVSSSEKFSVKREDSNSQFDDIEVIPVETFSQIIRTVMADLASACYLGAIEPICKAVGSKVKDYLDMEAKNEQFKDYYMYEVVRTYDNFRDLSYRLAYYKNQLRKMEVAKAANRPVTAVCDEINKVLKGKNPFTASILGRYKITDESLDTLKNQDLPTEIIEKLAKLKDEEFTPEYQFVEALEETIGEENVRKYQWNILESAIIHDEDNLPGIDFATWDEMIKELGTHKLTAESIENLKSNGVPESICKQLKGIVDVTFSSREAFVNRLKQLLKKVEEYESFLEIIIDIADVSNPEIKFTDFVGRFRRAVFHTTHPDKGNGTIDEFRIARNVSESLDVVLMQALILQYWPRYVETMSGSKEVNKFDDMSCFDSVVRFSREAKVVEQQFFERCKRRKEMDELTQEQAEWSKGKQHGYDTVQEKKEGLIVRCLELELRVKETIGAIQKLCREAKQTAGLRDKVDENLL